MTEIYYMTIKEAEKLPEFWCREHFPARFEKSGRFRFEADRLRCIGAGALLAGVLNIKEEELQAGPRGKLFVPGARKHFNLSHSGEYIVLAVSDGEVGVDIERQDQRHLDVAGRVLQPEELAWMKEPAGPDAYAATAEEQQTADNARGNGRDAASAKNEITARFFRLWTLKESAMKQTGQGLSLPPESFSVLPLINGDGILLETGGREQWLYAEMFELPAHEPAWEETAARTGSYSLAVCMEHPEKVKLCPVSQFYP